MLDNQSPRPRHLAAPAAPAHLASSTAWPVRASVCTAGLAIALVGSLLPASFAVADEPSIGWDPDVPSLDPNNPVIDGSGGGNDGGSEAPVDPPTVDPEPVDPAPVDPAPVDPEPVIPDSGYDGYEQDYLYPNGTGSVGGEGAFFDPAEETAVAEEQPIEAVEEGPSVTVTAPTFGSYEAQTGTLTGSAQPGSIVCVIDAAGNVLGTIVADANGQFSILLPLDIDLSGLSIYMIDEAGNQVGEVLSGASVVEGIARQELEAVRVATGASTADLAEGLVLSVERAGLAAEVQESVEEAMPILPYVLGAASAVVAAGAVAAGVALCRRRPSDNANAGSLPSRAANESPAAAGKIAGAAALAGTAAPLRPVAAQEPAADDYDDLEQLAVSLYGGAYAAAGTKTSALDPEPDDDPTPPDDGPGGGERLAESLPADSTLAFLASMGISLPTMPPKIESPTFANAHMWQGVRSDATELSPMPGGDPDVTVAVRPGVEAPLDGDAFDRLARVLATGSGKVHRITRSSDGFDLAGLERIDESPHGAGAASVADPLVAQEDWCEIAMRELTASVQPTLVRDQPHLSTDDYVALVSTQRLQGAVPVSPSPVSYVAPIVGPSSVSAEEAVRHQEMLRRSTSATAVALKNRDAAFKSQRKGTAVERQSSTGGVPTIARGVITPGPAQQHTSLSSRMHVERQFISVPDPSCFAPVPTPPLAASVCDRGMSAAVSAAQSAYAAYGSISERPVASVSAPACPGSQCATLQQPAPVSDVSSSVAAAYASAVYGNNAIPERTAALPVLAAEPVATVPQDQFAFQEGVASPVARPLPAVGFAGDFSDPFSTSSDMSAAYINYMVQDEFEHRHDTIAQRNAALGRMHIVNGAAQAPRSLVARRHPA